jgi:hypothetical protein
MWCGKWAGVFGEAFSRPVMLEQVAFVKMKRSSLRIRHFEAHDNNKKTDKKSEIRRWGENGLRYSVTFF